MDANDRSVSPSLVPLRSLGSISSSAQYATIDIMMMIFVMPSTTPTDQGLIALVESLKGNLVSTVPMALLYPHLRNSPKCAKYCWLEGKSSGSRFQLQVQQTNQLTKVRLSNNCFNGYNMVTHLKVIFLLPPGIHSWSQRCSWTRRAADRTPPGCQWGSSWSAACSEGLWHHPSHSLQGP